MEKKYARIIWFSKRTWFYQRVIKNIYTGMGECLSEYKHLYIPCISRKYGTVYCLWFLSTKEGCSIPDYQLFDTLYRNADVVVVATPVYGLSFPAFLKAVFDRTQQYYEAYVSRHIKYPLKSRKRLFYCLFTVRMTNAV